jgi:hypothetical protein
METAVADVLRAAEGGALVGSATLGLCVIDYLAYLRPVGDTDSESYKQIVTDYLAKVDARYVPEQIFAWRCAMVHTYAEARALARSGLRGFMMRHRDPAFHLMATQPPALLISVDIFVADVIWSARQFFSDVDGDPDVETRAESLMIVSSGMDLVSGYTEWRLAALTYESMHPSLRELDSQSPELLRLRSDVAAIYPARDDGTHSPPTSGSMR